MFVGNKGGDKCEELLEFIESVGFIGLVESYRLRVASYGLQVRGKEVLRCCCFLGYLSLSGLLGSLSQLSCYQIIQ